jgi:beta-lactamase class D
MKGIGVKTRHSVLALLSFLALGALAPGASAFCEARVSVEDLGRYFQGFEGSFVLYDVQADAYALFNEKAAGTRIPPCSSFKVVNSLIGLETEAVADENAVFKWDGVKRPLAAWNRDLTLAEAIKVSAYWCYQRIAREVGEARMQNYLDDLGFGNRDISGGIDQFWQQSSLKISPREWVDMIARITSYDVPFSRRSVDILRKLIRLDEKGGAILYGKTGSGTDHPGFYFGPDAKTVSGWFIGWVEKGDRARCFAAHIAAKDDATGMKAREIALAILRDKGIF